MNSRRSSFSEVFWKTNPKNSENQWMTASPAMKEYKNNVFITYSFSVVLEKKKRREINLFVHNAPFLCPRKHQKICECGIILFASNVPFLYPLKVSENFTVFWCFQGVEKRCIGNKWVNTALIDLTLFTPMFPKLRPEKWNSVPSHLKHAESVKSEHFLSPDRQTCAKWG